MTRHPTRRPRGCDGEDDPPFTQDITIFEADDDGWIDTGLLDLHGEPILRTEKGPLGFDLSPR